MVEFQIQIVFNKRPSLLLIESNLISFNYIRGKDTSLLHEDKKGSREQTRECSR